MAAAVGQPDESHTRSAEDDTDDQAPLDDQEDAEREHGGRDRDAQGLEMMQLHDRLASSSGIGPKKLAGRLAPALNALERHLALIGFMGAGKSTVGAELAARLGRRFVDCDREVERSAGLTVAQFFEQRGEAEFRVLEAEHTVRALQRREPSVFALGGGALSSTSVRRALRETAFTVLLDVDAATAWQRVRGGERPLARDEARFRALFEQRRPVYVDAADAIAADPDGAVLAAAGVHVEAGALERLGALVPGAAATALVSDPHVGGIHGATAQLGLGARLVSTHELPAGEDAKRAVEAERLWNELHLE